MPQTARVLAAATTIAGSVGAAVVGTGVTTALADTPADTPAMGTSVVSHLDYASNTVAAAITRVGDKGDAAAARLIHDVRAIPVTSVPLNEAPVTALLQSGGRLQSLHELPVIGGLVPDRL